MNKTKKIMDDIILSKIPILIGLVEQGHIPTIEKMLQNNKNWYDIGKAIGWDGNTAKEHYSNYLDNLIEQYFIKCDFNDECDTCHNEDNEQSYMSGTMEGADYYICRSCALKYIHALEKS